MGIKIVGPKLETGTYNFAIEAMEPKEIVNEYQEVTGFRYPYKFVVMDGPDKGDDVLMSLNPKLRFSVEPFYLLEHALQCGAIVQDASGQGYEFNPEAFDGQCVRAELSYDKKGYANLVNFEKVEMGAPVNVSAPSGPPVPPQQPQQPQYQQPQVPQQGPPQHGQYQAPQPGGMAPPPNMQPQQQPQPSQYVAPTLPGGYPPQGGQPPQQ